MINDKFILLVLSNLWSAHVNDEFDQIKCRIYQLSPDQNADFDPMRNEVIQIMNQIVSLVPEFHNKDLRVKSSGKKIEQNTFPLIIPMFFYQLMENVRQMDFGAEDFVFFKCNLTEIVLPTRRNINLIPDSNKFLLTNVAFKPVEDTTEVVPPQESSVLPQESSSKKRKVDQDQEEVSNKNIKTPAVENQQSEKVQRRSNRPPKLNKKYVNSPEKPQEKPQKSLKKKANEVLQVQVSGVERRSNRAPKPNPKYLK